MEGYGVVGTASNVRELRAEAQHCEMCGWRTVMEDECTDIEEAVWAGEDETGSADWAEAAAALLPSSPARPRCFGVLHLFSGAKREQDLEWWLLALAAPRSTCGSRWSPST